jgi:hypothetical protein
MQRWTIKKVIDGDIVNDISSSMLNVIMNRLSELKAQGIEAWDCDNLQEILVG